MPQSPLPPDSADDLQFATVEPGKSGSPLASLSKSCALCRQPIVTTYFALGDKTLCPTCCDRVNAPPPGSRFGRFVKASFMGLGAGLVGALIWFAIRRVTHYEIGLVAILVGFMVGKAVRAGSQGRGGRGYQVLAVVVTYCCITANYMPDVLEAVFKSARARQAAADSKHGVDAKNQEAKKSAPAGGAAADPARKPDQPFAIVKAIAALAILLVFAFALSLALPFFTAAQNPIGLLIIGFALWQAWKFNARRPLPISGPYQIGPRPPYATSVEIITAVSPGGTTA